MRILVVFSVVGLLACSLLAQRAGAPSTPLQGGAVTASELAAIVASQPKDRNANQVFLQLAPYNVTMEHRVMAAAAAIHDKEAELFYVIDGSGTLVTGGKLVDATRNGDNQNGPSIEGGATRKVTKGDFVLVQEGQPHWFSAIDGQLTLMSLHLPRTPAAK
ncbi:MAG TPA: cupin domain-containing protein [Terriglobia bacterium]|nr:cupin domain-containing protein [Terriglobia bacterium]